ncbi:MAG: FAD-dependent oxidoreductase, partial [Pseudobdellovibrio sp.]
MIENKSIKTKVAIIGGGIFGATAAYILAKEGFKVTLFEKESELFGGASLFNHNRHHFGFHYPRIVQTAQL